MTITSPSISRRDDGGSTFVEDVASVINTDTSTSKKSLTYTLPTIYSTIATTTEDYAIQSEDPGQYHITLFTPRASLSAATTTTKITAPSASIPMEYSVLVSRAPNEVIRSTHSWLATTTSISASASSTPSSVSVKNSSGLNKGKLAGVIIGSIAGVLIAFYLFYVVCWGRQKALHKLRQEKELQESEKTNARVSTINLDYDSEDEDEKQHVNHDDNQPVGLPRSQPYYDPNRVYHSTSRSNPKEDFRSYYRIASNNTSSASSSSEDCNASLNAHANLQPFYGGFNPYYGPILQHQPSALFFKGSNRDYSKNNSIFYPPQQSIFSPVNSLDSTSVNRAPNMGNHFNSEAFKETTQSHIYNASNNQEHCENTVSPLDDIKSVLDIVEQDVRGEMIQQRQ
ncbi:hypothetical protein [Parasitella parasitica]|uniref:Uncharacterized protein n=1 Tax=Parasitella parasitica TaxID=35722 RepID=A0A0B7NA04_9FUNG|nr:hypothetical protein [Parasitella parasitica]